MDLIQEGGSNGIVAIILADVCLKLTAFKLSDGNPLRGMLGKFGQTVNREISFVAAVNAKHYFNGHMTR